MFPQRLVISLRRAMDTPRLVFMLCLVLVFFALGWMSATLLQMESSQRGDGLRREREEAVRHALADANTDLFEWLAEENSHPYFDYLASHAPERAYDDLFAPPRAGETTAPSAFLLDANPFARLHFLVVPSGEISSPEAPSPEWRAPAAPGAGTRAAEALAALRDKRAGADFHAVFPVAAGAAIRRAEAGGGGLFSAKESPSAPAWRGVRSASPAASAETAGGGLRFTGGMTPFYPVWLDGELYLLRRAGTTQGDCIQGVWVNWPLLQSTLSAAASERLPGARFLPAPESSAKTAAAPPEDGSRLLALPAVLEAAAPPAEDAPVFSRTRVLLAACWVFAALALAGLGGLFLGAVSLSERRASFVSAVTHELRTPLTTFQLYTEMLADGMVAESARNDYIATLRAEAVRLTHLVENVLGFARLEKGRALRRDETLSVADILGRCAPRIRDRFEAGGMWFKERAADGVENILLRTDGTAVEQILFNLADNASKYASGEGRGATLSVAADAGAVAFEFADNGAGVPASALRKMFQPFNRSAEDAAGGKPGVGLGLAFSRQLARRLGGDLKLAHTGPDGSVFRLTLPRSKGE
jgi:signal transduction histidine kinase